MVATIVGRTVPAGFKAIDDEQVRGSLLELYAAARNVANYGSDRVSVIDTDSAEMIEGYRFMHL
jgi:hypothetical protein